MTVKELFDCFNTKSKHFSLETGAVLVSGVPLSLGLHTCRRLGRPFGGPAGSLGAWTPVPVYKCSGGWSVRAGTACTCPSKALFAVIA